VIYGSWFSSPSWSDRKHIETLRSLQGLRLGAPRTTWELRWRRLETSHRAKTAAEIENMVRRYSLRTICPSRSI
jgi:hypothetical protein